MIIGIDVGGTHIDGVVIEDRKILKKNKIPTGKDLFQSICELLKELIVDIDKTQIRRINLSTTVSTNAIVEEKISKVAMFIQAGAGRNYELLKPGDENINITGNVDHRGNLIKGFQEREILDQIENLKNQGIENCGIVGKFSIRNPEEELKGEKILKDHDIKHISMGHRMSGNLNFPRRVYTTYLNEAVYNTWNNFITSLENCLKEEDVYAPIYILKADGGTMNLDEANEKPVETILSGPAASFMGISSMFKLEEDSILLDIGGTTTDIFFMADGISLFEPLGIKIKDYKTLVRAIYSVSIGLGGDSELAIEHGEIKVGPRRQGVALGLGGEKPTPTDAMIALRLLDMGDIEASKNAMEEFGKALNLSMEETAKKILDTMTDIIEEKILETLKEINSQPVYTIKELLYGKEIQPKEIKIIGGPANVMSPLLEKRFNIPCQYPEDYELANAIGASLAMPTREINLLADTQKGILTVSELGIYEKIDKRYDLKAAEERAVQILKDFNRENHKERDLETQIIESNSFNMVDGFYTTGKNIRIKAQIKPGLIYRLEEKKDEEK